MPDYNYGEICWTEHATPDPKKSKEFYSKLFGWQFTDHQLGDMTYTMIQKGEGKAFGGMWQIPTEQQDQIPPHWMSYVLVKNIEESLKAAEQHGATVCVPVTNVAEMGRFVIISDPVGAKIALWETLQRP